MVCLISCYLLLLFSRVSVIAVFYRISNYEYADINRLYFTARSATAKKITSNARQKERFQFGDAATNIIMGHHSRTKMAIKSSGDEIRTKCVIFRTSNTFFFLRGAERVVKPCRS